MAQGLRGSRGGRVAGLLHAEPPAALDRIPDRLSAVAQGAEEDCAMSKYTPGEWQKGEAGGYNIVSFDGFDIIGIAKVPNPFNINLIVAAPDLLEALRNIVSMADAAHWDNATTGMQLLLDDAHKAIRKAEGDE